MLEHPKEEKKEPPLLERSYSDADNISLDIEEGEEEEEEKQPLKQKDTKLQSLEVNTLLPSEKTEDLLS